MSIASLEAFFLNSQKSRRCVVNLFQCSHKTADYNLVIRTAAIFFYCTISLHVFTDPIKRDLLARQSRAKRNSQLEAFERAFNWSSLKTNSKHKLCKCVWAKYKHQKWSFKWNLTDWNLIQLLRARHACREKSHSQENALNCYSITFQFASQFLTLIQPSNNSKIGFEKLFSIKFFVEQKHNNEKSFYETHQESSFMMIESDACSTPCVLVNIAR